MLQNIRKSLFEECPDIKVVKDVLLSPEDLQIHAAEIAKEHSVYKNRKSIRCLLKRLDFNLEEITNIYKDLNQKAERGIGLSLASEWLLDNYYKIEEQAKMTRLNLLKEKFLKLNMLNSGFYKGYPRIYAIMMEYVSHTDSILEEEHLIEYIRAYQKHNVLTIAEIWAISLTTRIALIESIRVICEQILQTQVSWEKAEQVLDKTKEEVIADIKNNIEVDDRVDGSYIQHLLNVLKNRGNDTEYILMEVSDKLIEFNITLDELIENEHKVQAGRKISIGNAITSLHAISGIDWNDVFESLSIVDEFLNKDPSGVYSLMDFPSRDYYRTQIENISKDWNISETRIAKTALDCAQRVETNEASEKKRHIGYYLIDKGRNALFCELQLNGAADKFHNHSLLVYLLPIMYITLLITGFFALNTYWGTTENRIFLSLLAGIIVLIPASDISVTFMNWIVTHTVKPSFLPRLAYKNGIPKDASTIVVIPTLLPNAARVKEIVQQMETHLLSNREENVYFALIGDFKDAADEELPQDKTIVETALNEIEALNKKYGKERNIFFYFQRRRRFCEKQGRWLGWERKRGALYEFHELLLGKKNTSYETVSADLSTLEDVRYILTVDADTCIPLDAAKSLIGIISHPLNIAVVDEEQGIVIEGYGLIQPRISVSIESTNKSTFTRIFAGFGGIDPYTTAISDVYQDLFGEGIFTGKGIYDFHVFHKLLKDAIPEHTVLSHDLLEGSYVRTGLTTDVYLIDGFPHKYSSYIMRQHRWVRGDWQLINWLSQIIKKRNGEKIINPLSGLSKWKIFDNLRRSSISIFQVLLFAAGVTIFRGKIVLWFGYALVSIFFPFIISLLDIFMKAKVNTFGEKPKGDTKAGVNPILMQGVLHLAFLPYHAILMVDAIVRTLYRVYISKKNLLEWVTAADMEGKLTNDLNGYIKRFKGELIFAGAAFILASFLRPQILFILFPLLVLWIAAPFLAYHVSREEVHEETGLSMDDKAIIRRIARKTWAYYEEFAGEESNYLPPDNYQEEPPNGLANRTSPTNIGFLVMAVLSARDLGYLSFEKTIDKIKATIETIEKMETWRGHLFNWYDTKSLEVLRPYYVSTVDSGNFISYLIVVREGLKESLEKPIIQTENIDGIKDTVMLMKSGKQIHLEIIDQIPRKEGFTFLQWIELVEKLNQVYIEDDYWGKKLKVMIMDYTAEIDQLFMPIKSLLDSGVTDSYSGLKECIENLDVNTSMIQLHKTYRELGEQIQRIRSSKMKKNENDEDLERVYDYIVEGALRAEQHIQSVKDLTNRIDSIINKAEFKYLYNERRQLFSIGYDVGEEKITNSYYDLLASEARTTSYLAVARRQVPGKHWFKMGRSLAIIDGLRSLVSWTGTMFEYMMPSLIMKNYRHTLFDETYRAVIKAQMKHGDRRNVPWGVSESGYYAFDMQLNYQYKAFGIPDLGLKRGLTDDTVISPYSTVLALSFYPKEALKNMHRLIHDGLEGKYGFYEAVDYTAKRLIHGEERRIVKSFMAHHQGMSLVAINNYLHDHIMQKRFHADPEMKAAEVLLQEKIPYNIIITKEIKEQSTPIEKVEKKYEKLIRTYHFPDTVLPHCHMLSNGRYSVLLTDRGLGYSKLENLQVTRWREELITGKYGVFIFLKNLSDNKVWSATLDPVKTDPDAYKVVFSDDKVEFLRTDDQIDTRTEIVISPEDNVEIRKVTITNHGNAPVTIEISSYLETVMANQSSDVAHPTFSNLFVRTELVSDYNGILASRRPREPHQEEIWSFHSMQVDGETIGGLQYETNRSNFIGRGKTIVEPASLFRPLTDTVGIVLDPIMSLRRTIKVEGGKSTGVTFVMGIGKSREEVREIMIKYHYPPTVARAFQMSSSRSEMEAAYLQLHANDVRLFTQLIPHIGFLSPLRRKYEELLKRNRKGQSSLWAYGISGDLPILLVIIKESDHMEIVKKMIQAHEYLKMKGLVVDLVILNEDESSYFQPLYQLIIDTASICHASHKLNQNGGIFIRNARTMDDGDRILLYASARIIVRGEEGSLEKQIQWKEKGYAEKEEMRFEQNPNVYIPKDSHLDVDYFNGYGGFSNDGKEYVIRLKENMQLPSPWLNVIANQRFGFQATENGGGFVWAVNSRENKLTNWTNDPVSDTPQEAIYLRDDETGEFWSITPLPIREKESYTIHHGLGYSRYEHESHGVFQELTMFVPTNEMIKINYVRLVNHSENNRKLTITYYVKPVLGVTDQITQPFLITEKKSEQDIIYVRNPYNNDYENSFAFVGMSSKLHSFTCNRVAFLEGGDLARPLSLKKTGLSEAQGAGLDTCIAVQTRIELKKDEEKELVFLLGYGYDEKETHQLVKKYKHSSSALSELENVQGYWQKVLGTIEVQTPDKSMDYLLNYWLMYQTIACRVWARSAFYQSGGAYGFRDQLQDTMNMLLVMPEVTRKQILLHCEHQFVEGDVQHWWHPGAGEKGIRTRFSDDLLWLPFVVSEYINCTEDDDLLSEEAYFLEEEPLKEHEDERYGIPRKSQEKGSVYEHCIRTIDRSLTLGSHGIPLMGSGDWNDGMNTVGNKGKGESVWLGWFLYDTLLRFVPLCKKMGDTKRENLYKEAAAKILEGLEENAWDGAWYIRAFYDDGSPLGSSNNTECIIDSLAQSWAVITGGGREDRVGTAMESAEKYLVSREEGLIKLFTPPFDKSDQEPGYIKGYVPGVRENGGQYTHAATWVIYALAVMGQGDKAWELYHMINPINHTRTMIECNVYKVEPYVMAADVYAVAPHIGRGGWTWYTGAAGWMYKVGMEYIMGLRKRGEKLIIDPCIPKDWSQYNITYTYKETKYYITIKNPKHVNKGVIEIQVDGEKIDEKLISLDNDGKDHYVEVIMG
ncbi:MAG: GH36-type glycosyl hydrolase domain-containing protein [Bacillota bacterium]